jgi:leucyl aminopeptidase
LEPGRGTAQAAVRYGIDFAATADRTGFTGTAGQTLVLELPVSHSPDSVWANLASAVILVGTGDGSPADHRQAGAALAGKARGRGSVTVSWGGESEAVTQGLVQGYLLGAYQPVKYGQGGRAARSPKKGTGDLTLLGSYSQAALDRARTMAVATALARDLGNWPSNWKTPATFADRAAAAAAGRGSVRVTSFGPDEVAALGMGGLVAVGSAAWRGPAADPSRGPRLLLATHTPKGVKGAPHIAIVGKGITFDSGGLDIKPPSGMAAMKTDMAGGATALAVVLAAAELAVPAKVTAVVPLAQNSVGAGSYRPGDVVTVYGGTTVEVGDTDAEGRLVLADALAYATATLGPDYLIDIATLTGAAKVALGPRAGAVFSSDGTLAARIEESGAALGESWWRLPLPEDLEEALVSENADLSSTAKSGVGAGAVTAALFLRRFAGSTRWAHLDVAGPARAASARDWTAPGATGFGVHTLTALVERLA